MYSPGKFYKQCSNGVMLFTDNTLSPAIFATHSSGATLICIPGEGVTECSEALDEEEVLEGLKQVYSRGRISL